MSSRKAKLPPGIDKRQDGKYRARVYYEGVQYSVGSYYTLTDAKAALVVARSEMARKVFVPPLERKQRRKEIAERERAEAVTVDEWAKQWLDSLVRDKRAPGTITSYRSTLKVHVLETFGSRRLIDVTESDVNALVNKIRAAHGPWENVARMLRTMFNAAVESKVGGLTASPVKVHVPKTRAARTMTEAEGVATPDEIRQLAGLMPKHLALAVDLAAWCALRLGECLGLQRRDFQRLDTPESASISITRQWSTKANPPRYTDPKAGSARVVAVPASLVPAIINHLNKFVGKDPSAPVFPSTIDKARPVSQTTFDNQWRKARDKVRPGLRFHDLRHTGLTVYARQGATLQELMRRGGHTSIDAAFRYQHADQARDRALTDKLDGLIGGSE